MMYRQWIFCFVHSFFCLLQSNHALSKCSFVNTTTTVEPSNSSLIVTLTSSISNTCTSKHHYVRSVKVLDKHNTQNIFCHLILKDKVCFATHGCTCEGELSAFSVTRSLGEGEGQTWMILGQLSDGGGSFSKEVEFDLNQSTDIFTTSSADTETTEAEASTINLKAFQKSQDVRFFILLGCFGAVLLSLIIVVGVVCRRRGRSSRLTSPGGLHTSERSARDGAVFHAARAGQGDLDPRVSGYAHVYTEIADGAYATPDKGRKWVSSSDRPGSVPPDYIHPIASGRETSTVTSRDVPRTTVNASPQLPTPTPVLKPPQISQLPTPTPVLKPPQISKLPTPTPVLKPPQISQLPTPIPVLKPPQIPKKQVYETGQSESRATYSRPATFPERPV